MKSTDFTSNCRHGLCTTRVHGAPANLGEKPRSVEGAEPARGDGEGGGSGEDGGKGGGSGGRGGGGASAVLAGPPFLQREKRLL